MQTIEQRDPTRTNFDADAREFVAWRAGDERAGRRLMSALRVRISCYVARFGRSDADDIVQEVMVACVRARERLMEPRALRRYAYVTARRLVARDLNRRDHEPLRGQSSAELADDFASDYEPLRTRLHGALQRIPGRYAEAVALYYLDGYRGPEIATRLGIPEGTARTRIRRGLAHLRRDMSRPRPLYSAAR